ncbi:MAG: LamG domain-containing protein [Planctomycetia bacterium]
MIGVLVSLAGGTAAADVTAYWRFETENGSAVSAGQQVGNAVFDSSGNNRTGQAYNSAGTLPSYTTTPVSSYPNAGSLVNLPSPNNFALNNNAGTHGQGVYLPASAMTNAIQSNFTVEAFIRPTAFDTDYKGIFRQRDGSGTSTYTLAFTLGPLFGGTGDDLGLSLMGPSGFAEVVKYQANFVANTTYHVAATYNGSLAKLFVNGAEVASASFTGFITSNYHAAIGNDPVSSVAASQLQASAFIGQIDEVRISNTALSPSEMLSATVVPEPGSAALALLGLGGAAWALRRRAAR